MPRHVGRGGRAIVKSFSYPNEFDVMILEIESIGRRENKSFSEIVIELLKNYAKEHSQSQNPQTKITLFETGLENAIPNIYEIIKNPKKIKKFYSLIKKRKDFQHLDLGVNILLNAHHNRDKELLRENHG